LGDALGALMRRCVSLFSREAEAHDRLVLGERRVDDLATPELEPIAPRTSGEACRQWPGRRRRSPPSAAQHVGGVLIGGQERFEGQLGERDVGGGGERREGGDEAEVAVGGGQL
jgi:hypothetical protein